MKLLAKAAAKKGHYSAGVIMNHILYVSGQLPIDSATGKIVEGDVKVQMKQALANVDHVLMQAGTSREHVGLCRVYLSDMKLWDDINDVYADFFGSHKPARVVVPTRALHYGALVEIEAAAEMPAE